MSSFHNQNLPTFQVRQGKTEYLFRSFVFGCPSKTKIRSRNIRQKDGRHFFTLALSFVYIIFSSVLRPDSLLMTGKIVNSTIKNALYKKSYRRFFPAEKWLLLCFRGLKWSQVSTI